MPLDYLAGCPAEESPFIRVAHTAQRHQEAFGPDGQKEEIIYGDRDGNDKRLHGFDTIDPGEDVGRISGKRGQHDEIDVVQRS